MCEKCGERFIIIGKKLVYLHTEQICKRIDDKKTD